MLAATNTNTNAPNEENAANENDGVTADSLRVCRYCLKSLESRESMKANRNCSPPITQLYEEIRMKLKEIDSDMDMYHDMSLSLKLVRIGVACWVYSRRVIYTLRACVYEYVTAKVSQLFIWAMRPTYGIKSWSFLKELH